MSRELVSTMDRKRSDSDDEPEDRCAKAKRYDVELPSAEVDLKLAEKLDEILRIGNTKRSRFQTNKPNEPGDLTRKPEVSANQANKNGALKSRNLSTEELRARLIKKYDTLVPELDPKRPDVRVVKILSASESIELGKAQARKQMERQMELSSISGNQLVLKGSLRAFRFNDGYEMPETSGNRLKTTSSRISKSVRLSDKVLTRTYEREADTDDDDVDDDDVDSGDELDDS